MDKQKIKSIPRLTTDNPVDNFQTALNFTDVSEDGWVWLRQPEMALTEYVRKLVKGHGSSIDLDCNDMELSETLTEHLFDDPKQSIDGLIAEHYTILWAYATLREKLKWYEDAGIPVIPDYGLNTIRRAINRYGTAPQLQELTGLRNTRFGMEPVEIARPPQSWGYVRELEEVRNEQEGE